ncbi:MAG: SMI1/KNR4 family protein [Desulfamplus sp.]|nr:SMI1/KNR4 family protein [Desulfamplus sp.]
MIDDILKNLSVKIIGIKEKNAYKDLEHFEKRIKAELPEDYKKILVMYAGPIIFNEQNIFKPIISSYLDREDGTQSVEILYGLGENEYSITAMLNRYEGRIPYQAIPIGEIGGGNLICMCIRGDRANQIYLWDHDNEREITGEPENDFGNMFLVSENFENFIHSIEKCDKKNEIDDLGIVESESWLDI